MIRPSPEIKAVIRRWNRAVRLRDAPTLRNLLSRSDALRYVGSDEGEYWYADVVRGGFVDHASEIPDFTEDETTLEAFEHGDTGWAIWLGYFTFAGQDEPGLNRISFVLTLEDGNWRIVHMHLSNPNPNIKKMGVELTALDALVEALRDGFAMDQREGVATVMFTDIADSSALAEQVGDRAWAATVAPHLTAVTEIVRANGGELVKSLGDGTMSVFRSANASLVAAVEIQDRVRNTPGDPPLRLRIGVHSGDVIQTDDDFFGTVVNKAARIAAAAAPDETRVSDATRGLAGAASALRFSDPQILQLKGVSGDHVVYRLDG